MISFFMALLFCVEGKLDFFISPAKGRLIVFGVMLLRWKLRDVKNYLFAEFSGFLIAEPNAAHHSGNISR
jgi:hypothetical protein